MTSPVTVTCWNGPCARTIYQGGTWSTEEQDVVGLPWGQVEDRDGNTFDLTGDTALTYFADSTCPNRTAGCPNTTQAIEEQRLRQPAVMAAAIKDLLARVTTLEARS